MIRLRYLNRDRIVEPHDYGEHNGTIKLLTYQVGGSSGRPLPNWRWIEVEQIADLHLLDQTFPGGRHNPRRPNTTSGNKLFIKVKPADQKSEA